MSCIFNEWYIFSDYISSEIKENLPCLYLTTNWFNKMYGLEPYLYSGSDSIGRNWYYGSSKKLNNDIHEIGKELFSKQIIICFKKGTPIEIIRRAESYWQQKENHRNSSIYYNLSDRWNGPGQPKGLYVGENRTEKQKRLDEKKRCQIGENRTEKQKEMDFRKTSWNKNNNETPIKILNHWKKLKELAGENRTEKQKTFDRSQKTYVGENRTEKQKIRDEKMKMYKGENRTERQINHHNQMKKYIGENRSQKQKMRDEKMKMYKGENRTERQIKGSIISSIKTGTHAILIDSNNNEIVIYSIRKFCEKYKLYRPSIMNLINEKIETYKGFRLKR